MPAKAAICNGHQKIQCRRNLYARQLRGRQKKINVVYEAIQRMQKQATLLSENLKKAEKLSSYYGFDEDRDRAWVYNLEKGKFALINREGDTLTGFHYSHPQDFKKGSPK